MLTIDEFESRFRAADKPDFRLDPPVIRSAVIVTDLEAEGPRHGPYVDAGGTQDSFVDAVKQDLRALGQDVAWVEITGRDYQDVPELLERVERIEPDLVVTYRNLRDGSWRWPYSLGCFLNVLIRETPYPVLIVPNPNEMPRLDWREAGTPNVMVITDHLAGDAELVNWGARMTESGGTLWLTHIEDDVVFERYRTAISKIPEIPTDESSAAIRRQLLSEPNDYIQSTRDILQSSHLSLSVRSVVQMGHRMRDYLALLEDHQVDLLCFHTASDDQVALHGATYLLAVQLRTLPILMI